ncbi:MAG: hypothetical protein JXQ29_11395 [Planctomycetes bacterium]|nr:hypothetical protein [Planctomycetota bacterium]
MRATVVALLFTGILTPPSSGQKATEPAFLLEDSRLGVTFFAPAGFLPDPEEAVRKKARHFWTGTARACAGWGLMTFHRSAPARGFEPDALKSVLEACWGPTEGAPHAVTIAELDALLFTTFKEEAAGHWVLLSLLIPIHDGIFDLTLCGPRDQRSRLQTLSQALGQTVRVRSPGEPRPFTLPEGVSLALSTTWAPVRRPPAGLAFRALRQGGRHQLELSVRPGVVEAEQALRTALALPADTPLETRLLQTAAGSFRLAPHPKEAGAHCAALLHAGGAVVVHARLAESSAAEEFAQILNTVRVAPAAEIERPLRLIASELRASGRSTTAFLRRKLAELIPFAGHPGAAEALAPLLAQPCEDPVFEAALAAAELAPFGPAAETLGAAFVRAESRGQLRATTALLLALGKSGDPAALHTLQRRLLSPVPALARAAVEGIGHLPFGDGAPMEALIALYECLRPGDAGAQSATDAGGAESDRYRLLYFPLLAALRRHSSRDFPDPGGAEAARKWLEERRRAPPSR